MKKICEKFLGIFFAFKSEFINEMFEINKHINKSEIQPGKKI